MNSPNPTPMRCRCDGRYEGCDHGPGNRRCQEYGPGRWSPYFCDPCDERRVNHIGAALREIRDDLTGAFPQPVEETR